ncbi:MAG TPA: hypothetical protein VGR65_08165 [Casimicrobiaceae bacterium]|jgi:hypothetical protein|nr:hypothetical protein [Casimicrobiaceae bacterium]
MSTETSNPRDERGSLLASAAGSSRIVRPANAEAAITRIRKAGRSVVTFLGFSGAGYEDALAVDRVIAKVLGDLIPTSALICAGATPEGIGAVYPLAKKRGFTTIGIVSALAEKEGATFSQDVDTVFVIADDTWGGLDADGKLSQTSSAMVGAADEMIAIGGGEIARDEIAAAMAMGKKVRYIVADMNHAAAIRKAKEMRQPEPDDFRGAVHVYFDRR